MMFYLSASARSIVLYFQFVTSGYILQFPFLRMEQMLGIEKIQNISTTSG